MPYYKFTPNDIFYNSVKTHPSVKFFMYSGSVYYNDRPVEIATRQASSDYNRQILHLSGNQGPDRRNEGAISLYEINVDRLESDMVYSFKTKDSQGISFKTVSKTSYFSATQTDDFVLKYPLSSSISSDYLLLTKFTSSYIKALKNTMNYYENISPHYAYSSSVHHPHNRDFDGTPTGLDARLISIPSIFYGSEIKKGTVDLKFYVTGSLIGRLQDINQNGELIRTVPTDSDLYGKVAGVVLYKEGFLILTGNYQSTNDVDGGTTTQDYYSEGVAKPRWVHFGHTGSWNPTDPKYNDRIAPSSSFSLEFSGTHVIPTMTAMAHAPRGELNFSSNPTYTDHEDADKQAVTGTLIFKELDKKAKNIVYSQYADPTASYEPQTYISKIGIFDQYRNLIAVAKLANPVRKREIDDYTFKLKLDI